MSKAGADIHLLGGRSTRVTGDPRTSDHVSWEIAILQANYDRIREDVVRYTERCKETAEQLYEEQRVPADVLV